jgi:hypothetical protein
MVVLLGIAGRGRIGSFHCFLAMTFNGSLAVERIGVWAKAAAPKRQRHAVNETSAMRMHVLPLVVWDEAQGAPLPA